MNPFDVKITYLLIILSPLLTYKQIDIHIDTKTYKGTDTRTQRQARTHAFKHARTHARAQTHAHTHKLT